MHFSTFRFFSDPRALNIFVPDQADANAPTAPDAAEETPAEAGTDPDPSGTAGATAPAPDAGLEGGGDALEDVAMASGAAARLLEDIAATADADGPAGKEESTAADVVAEGVSTIDQAGANAVDETPGEGGGGPDPPVAAGATAPVTGPPRTGSLSPVKRAAPSRSGSLSPAAHVGKDVFVDKGKRYIIDAKGKKRRMCDQEGCMSYARSAGKCPRQLMNLECGDGRQSTTPRKPRPKTAESAKKRKRGEEEEIPDFKKRAPHGSLCVLPGCQEERRSRHSLCCSVPRCKKVEERLASTLNLGGEKDTKDFKPLFKKGDKVYGPFWSPRDRKREKEPTWYPGTVMSYSVNKRPNDARYGPVRQYNLKYEDGDRQSNVPDHLVFAEEDYELEKEQNEENEKRKNPVGWKGVKNVTDKTSKDQWAKNAGWYVATIFGEKRDYSSLAEALWARDASVVRKKGVLVKAHDLNFPGDWEELFEKEKVAKKDAPPEVPRCRALDGCKKKAVPGCDGYCLEHFKILELDQEKVKAVVAEIRKNLECVVEGCNVNKVKKFDSYCRKCYKEKFPEEFEAIMTKEKEEKAKKEAKKEAREAAARAKEQGRVAAAELNAYIATATDTNGNAGADGATSAVVDGGTETKLNDSPMAVADENVAESNESGAPAVKADGGTGVDEATATLPDNKSENAKPDAKESSATATGENGSAGADGTAVAAGSTAPVDATAKDATAALASDVIKAIEATPAKTKKKLTPAQMCKLKGCEKRKKGGSGGYCGPCAPLALRLSAPISSTKDKGALKSVQEAGAKVYAAYWPPEDMDREEKPSWQPGVVTHRKEDEAADEAYGATYRYNVTYDSGDRLRGLEEQHVCTAEDYDTRLSLDVLGPNGGRTMASTSWRGVKGVRNVNDKKSKDLWARHVGWYQATIDGKKHDFTSLKDALRAYDAATVRRKGISTVQNDLHFPEEWNALFQPEEEKKEKKKKEKKAKKAKRQADNGDEQSKQPPKKKRKVGEKKGTPALSVDGWLMSLPPHLVVKLTLSLPPLNVGRMGMTLKQDEKTYGLPMITGIGADSPLRNMIPPFVVQNYCMVSIDGEEDGITEIRSIKDFTREVKARRKEVGESLQELRLVVRRGMKPMQSTGPLYI